MPAAPLFIDRIEAAVDHVLDTVKGDIVLGLPLGIGKPSSPSTASPTCAASPTAR